jgi:prepilin-type N-terminal cleavage/methylation domain-containing protein
MNLQQTSSAKRGFTLAELVVAMAITAIIVTVLVTVTSVALDTWNRSRSELRAARNAKTMVDFMARDFESLVIRKGNSYEWLSAVALTDSEIANIGGNKTSTNPNPLTSTNALKLIFFTSAKDRYDGKIATSSDKGGEVSCIGYQLNCRDPITGAAAADAALQTQTYAFNRVLVDPDNTFTDLLGKPDLQDKPGPPKKTGAFTPYWSLVSDSKSFICENVYQFTVTFQVNVTTVAASGATPATTVNVPVIIGPVSGPMTATSFIINGTGIVSDITTGGPVTNAQLAAGKITGVSISTTVISDFGIQQMKQRTFTAAQLADFIAKHSYQYTKLVSLSPP